MLSTNITERQIYSWGQIKKKERNIQVPKKSQNKQLIRQVELERCGQVI